MAERQESRKAREHFQTFLRGQGVSESTVGVYSGALGKIGGGTRLLQGSGLCPEGRTVLELTGPDAKKIAVWWTAERRKSVTNRSVRPAIDNYLVWQGAAPEKKEETAFVPQTPRFSAPEHGLTLGLCLRAFCAGSTEPRRETMTRLLRILLGNPHYEYGERSGEDLAEESSRYPALRETLLERLEKKDALVSALEDEFFDSLTDCARALLTAVKQRCAGKILEDYAHRDDPFAGSIPAALSDLYAASRGGAARNGDFGEAGPYLALLEAVARDGETACRRRDDVPEEFGTSLGDPALWQQGLLPDWLDEVIDWKNPPAQAELDALYAATAAMGLETAEYARRVERLLARLLSGLTGDFSLPEETEKRDALAQAVENTARAVRIYRACPAECARALEKKRSGTWCIPQPSALFAVPERSVYEAKLLTRQGELLCRLAKSEERPENSGVRRRKPFAGQKRWNGKTTRLPSGHWRMAAARRSGCTRPCAGRSFCAALRSAEKQDCPSRMCAPFTQTPAFLHWRRPGRWRKVRQNGNAPAPVQRTALTPCSAARPVFFARRWCCRGRTDCFPPARASGVRRWALQPKRRWRCTPFQKKN